MKDIQRRRECGMMLKKMMLAVALILAMAGLGACGSKADKPSDESAGWRR